MRVRTVLAALWLAAAPAGAEPVAFALQGCDYVELVTRVDASRVRPHVPAPFVLLETAGTAEVHLGGARCPDAVTGTERGPASFGFVLTPVAMPADLRVRGIGVRLWFYRLDHLVVAGDPYDRVAAAAGVDRRHVDAIDVRLPAVDAALEITEGTSATIARLPAALPDPRAPGGGIRWREFHVVEGGIAYLEATLRPGGASIAPIAHIAPAPGTIAHAVLGDLAAGQPIAGPGFAIEDARMDVLTA